MSMIGHHNYYPDFIEQSYNVKWTLLSHVKYIVTKKKELNDIFTGANELTDRSFVDFLPENRPAYPVFAVDYLGERNGPTGSVGTYAIEYRGNDSKFELNYSYGIVGVKRSIQVLHDSIIGTLRGEYLSAGIHMYDFTDHNNPPRDTGHLFEITLEESTFEFNPITQKPMGGFDLIYSVQFR